MARRLKEKRAVFVLASRDQLPNEQRKGGQGDVRGNTVRPGTIANWLDLFRKQSSALPLFNSSAS